MLYVTPNISIHEREIHEEFIHASGPGGQNVNKVSTAVKLRFDVLKSPSLTDEVRKRLIRLAGKRVNREGILVIDARRFRTQEQNRKDGVEKLVEFIRRASHKPRPRLKTKPTLASKQHRLDLKHRRSDRKRLRKTVKGLGKE